MKTINIKNSSLKNILRKKVLLKKCISTFDIQNIYIIKFCIIKAETKIVLLNKIYVSNVILQIWLIKPIFSICILINYLARIQKSSYINYFLKEMNTKVDIDVIKLYQTTLWQRYFGHFGHVSYLCKNNDIKYNVLLKMIIF